MFSRGQYIKFSQGIAWPNRLRRTRALSGLAGSASGSNSRLSSLLGVVDAAGRQSAALSCVNFLNHAGAKLRTRTLHSHIGQGSRSHSPTGSGGADNLEKSDGTLFSPVLEPRARDSFGELPVGQHGRPRFLHRAVDDERLRHFAPDFVSAVSRVVNLNARIYRIIAATFPPSTVRTAPVLVLALAR